ncbi:protein transport protein Sec16A [Platysternon megacephalum]|uniref:Protein transport protein Sec16A n=1 Tax=Platysternon megacephalum TaxID=55544 RepID=A0A4D9EFG7_9SAUR|nr:protein transport protein Sec16A [Platysternon megacephalum]
MEGSNPDASATSGDGRAALQMNLCISLLPLPPSSCKNNYYHIYLPPPSPTITSLKVIKIISPADRRNGKGKGWGRKEGAKKQGLTSHICKNTYGRCAVLCRERAEVNKNVWKWV